MAKRSKQRFQIRRFISSHFLSIFCAMENIPVLEISLVQIEEKSANHKNESQSFPYTQERFGEGTGFGKPAAGEMCGNVLES